MVVNVMLEKMWEEAFVACFTVLWQLSPWEAEETHEKL